MNDLVAAVAALPERSLLLLDDDAILCRHLGRALDAHGFATRMVGSVADAIEAVRSDPPAFAVLDLRLTDGSGLKVVQILRDYRHDARIVMLTGYGNIATAVAAVRAGAVDYLAKPADAEDVVRALLGTVAGGAPAPPENPMSADRVRWEHIQRVYELCGRNVSETARRLGMHRRTLQRILAKRAPREDARRTPLERSITAPRAPRMGIFG
jgi:two-component system response regulator RegA